MKLKNSISLFLLFIVIKGFGLGCIPPDIISQPVNAVVCSGNDTSFSIIATGPSLIYQWQVDQGAGFVNLTNVLPYSGVTTPLLSITGVTISLNNYSFRCIVSNGCVPNDTSNFALLKVNVAPGIFSQPSNTAICETQNGSFALTTSGTGLSYQWQVNTGSGFNNVSSAPPYSGDTTATLYITGAVAAMNGYVYQCIISGSCSSAITSNPATLTVNTLPAITAQPYYVSTCDGSNVSIAISATGTALTYQWQVNPGSGYSVLTNSPPYSGVNTSTLLITGATASMNGYLYQCVVSGACIPADPSYEIPLIIYPVYNNTFSVTICQGNSYTFGPSTLTAPGFYSNNFTSVYGCDSLVYLSLNVSPAYYTTTTSTICDGDTIILGGIPHTTSGVYTYVLPTVNGCDSTIQNTLTVNPSYHFNQSVIICNGDSALIYGSYQKIAGIYYDNYTTMLGCDSIYSTSLIVNPTYNLTMNLGICMGDSILIGSVYESAGGSYLNHYTTITGCDSSVTSMLTVYPNYMINQTTSICFGDSILLGGIFQHSAGTYTDLFTSFHGCDSTVVTTLTVNPTPSVSFAALANVCDTTAAFTLAGGSPAGGIYSGAGVTGGSVFSPGVAGIGTHIITYTYTDSLGCIGIKTSDIQVTTCVGIIELVNDSSFGIYPNPFTDKLTITSDIKEAVLLLYNVLGQTVLVQQIMKGTTDINTADLPKGVYLIQLNASGKIISRKIIKG